MKRFKNILVTSDNTIGSDDALEQAVSLAKDNDAHLTIASVLRNEQATPAHVAEAEKRLQRLATSARQSGVANTDIAVLPGTPFLEIIRQVLRRGHDLVITSAEAGNVLREVFFGSTATHLMRKCPCPVWVVKPGQPVPYGRILAAIDPHPDAAEDGLNTKILDLATSLASRDHATLHILHAWEVDGNDADTIASEITAAQRREILDRHEKKHRDLVNNLLSRYPMDTIDHHVLLPRQRPEQSISSLAKSGQIDLIVMGTLARTGIPGFFIGNVAEYVLSVVKCGTLTVKADGFETPVSLPDWNIQDSPSSDATRENSDRVA